MKIIVLSKTDYRENDVIINAISEEEEISFLVRGARNPTSPFKWLNTTLTEADVEFVSPNKYKHPVLKRASLLSSPLSRELSLDKIISISLVGEAVIKMLDENERYCCYQDLISFSKTLQTEESDSYLLVLTFLAKAMKIAGFLPEINGCVHCGRKDQIVAFSFSDGGMVCEKCSNTETKRDLTPTQMKLVRIVFSAPNYSYSLNFSYRKEDMIIILLKFKEFIADTIGIDLDNITLLCNI